MNQARMQMQETQQRLATEARAVVDDAQELLRLAAHEAGAEVAEARGRLEQSLASARASILRLERAAVDRAYAAGRATDDYVHQNPWQAIAAGAAVGALIGALLARR